MQIINNILEYAFLQRALVVGILVVISLAILGVNLVLKKYSNIGDGLAHVSFGAIAFALALGFSPLQFSIPVVIIAAFILLLLGDSAKIKGDAAIAMMASVSIAIGIIAISLSGGVNISIDSYMFGSILAIGKSDYSLSIVILSTVIVIYLFFYNKFFAITFDEDFAQATGVNVKLLKALLSVLTALAIVVGIRMIGTILISSLIIFPASTAMLLSDDYKRVMFFSIVLSVASFLIGLFSSFYLNIPVGASIVVANFVLFVLAYLYKKYNVLQRA
jgi:ABC-type Mn2+/Zn2+ transport system permease subunit